MTALAFSGNGVTSSHTATTTRSTCRLRWSHVSPRIMSVGQEKKFKIITTRHDHKAEDDFDLGMLFFSHIFLLVIAFRFRVVLFAFCFAPAIAVLGIRLAALTEGNRR